LKPKEVEPAAIVSNPFTSPPQADEDDQESSPVFGGAGSSIEVKPVVADFAAMV